MRVVLEIMARVMHRLLSRTVARAADPLPNLTRLCSASLITGHLKAHLLPYLVMHLRACSV